MNWKVTVNINDFKEQRTIFLKDIDTKEEAYSTAKRYFIIERPEIDFCGVEEVVVI